jgi:hypothetical protein
LHFVQQNLDCIRPGASGASVSKLVAPHFAHPATMLPTLNSTFPPSRDHLLQFNVTASRRPAQEIFPCAVFHAE